MSEIFNESTRVLIVQIYSWYVFVPVVLGALFWRRLNNAQKFILYIAILSAVNHKISQVVRTYLATDSNNAWVAHAYVPFIFWFTWRLYKNELKVLFSSTFFNITLIICLCFFGVNSLFIQNLKILPTNGIFLISGVFIFWGVSYFYSLLKQTVYKSLEKEPVFWFTTGVIMYYSSTFLIFLLVYNYLDKDSETTYIASIFNAFFNLVLVTTYIISIWVKPPK